MAGAEFCRRQGEQHDPSGFAFKLEGIPGPQDLGGAYRALKKARKPDVHQPPCVTELADIDPGDAA